MALDLENIFVPNNLDEQLKAFDKGNYLLLEGREHNSEHGSYSYPDLYVAKSLSHHGKDWHQCHEALHAEGFEMLTPRQFVDFLNLLKSGKAFDGKGTKVSSLRLETIFQEITARREPLRDEWLDAQFENKEDKLYINYEHCTINGELKPQRSEPLLPYPTQFKLPGISLDDYLQRATAQGLPPADIKFGDLGYYPPSDGFVANFFKSAPWVLFSGGFSPRNSGYAIGVRRARAKN